MERDYLIEHTDGMERKITAIFAAFETEAASDEAENCLLAGIIFWAFVRKASRGNEAIANHFSDVCYAAGRRFTKEMESEGISP